MIIKQLILSGASTKVGVFVGAYECLLENGILDSDLTGIEEIVCCSISFLFSLFLLLGAPLSIMKQCCIEGKMENFIKMDDINLNSLFDDYGLSDNQLIASLVKNYLLERHDCVDMTLKELYDKKPIKVTVKCVNVSKGCLEYINHETDPDISILKLLMMTTSIPFIFKPVEYRGSLYVDGGLCGSLPLECSCDDYLAIRFKTTKYKVDTLFNYLLNLITISPVDMECLQEDRCILYKSDIEFSEFILSEQQKIDLIEGGYRITQEHIQKHNLTNDLFIPPHPVDRDPKEEDAD